MPCQYGEKQWSWRGGKNTSATLCILWAVALLIFIFSTRCNSSTRSVDPSGGPEPIDWLFPSSATYRAWKTSDWTTVLLTSSNIPSAEQTLGKFPHRFSCHQTRPPDARSAKCQSARSLCRWWSAPIPCRIRMSLFHYEETAQSDEEIIRATHISHNYITGFRLFIWILVQLESDEYPNREIIHRIR